VRSRRLRGKMKEWCPMTRVTLACIWLAAISCTASWAQSGPTPFGNPSRPTVGGRMPSDFATTPTFGASGSNELLRHRGPTGNTCLTVNGYPRSHTVNPNVYDHVIAAVNGCAQRIAIRVCYYRTQDCIPMEIPGNERKEAILGTLPAVRDFRFEFREKF
jgi:hypothetical protein